MGILFWPPLANFGQPELLEENIFQVPWEIRCLRRVCDQAKLSARYDSRDMGTPWKSGNRYSNFWYGTVTDNLKIFKIGFSKPLRHKDDKDTQFFFARL